MRWAICRGLIAGCVGGLVAAAVLSLLHGALAPLTQRGAEDSPPRPEAEDATVKVATAITSAVAGREVPAARKPLAGSIVHYGFGATTGAAYGAVSEVFPRAAIGAGMPFGAAVWLGAHVLTVPALGLAEWPTRRPWAAEALELILHLVYGLTTDMVRRLVLAFFGTTTSVTASLASRR
jgi:putative membrane protein